MSGDMASIVMTDGSRIVTVPRHDPVDALTMGGIVWDAGLTPRNSADFSEPARNPAGRARAAIVGFHPEPAARILGELRPDFARQPNQNGLHQFARQCHRNSGLLQARLITGTGGSESVWRIR